MPLQWFDAQLNDVVGFTPVPGETYLGRLNILFDDGIVITRNINFTAHSGSIIASIVDTGTHIRVDAALLMRGGNGGLCSISIRNLWWHKNISDIIILVNDEVVMEMSTNLRTGEWWAGSGMLSYPVFTHQTYNVTVQIQTSDGDTCTLSRTMSPEPLCSFSNHEEQ